MEGNRAGGVTAEEYRRLETGDILYFSVDALLDRSGRPSFLAGSETERDLSQEHQLSAPSGPAQGGGSERPRGEGPNQGHSARLFEQRGGVSDRVVPEVRRALAYRPCQLPSDRGSGPSCNNQGRNDLIHIDNFPSRPSHGDRILARFSESEPRTVADLDHVGQLRGAGSPVCPPGWVAGSSWYVESTSSGGSWIPLDDRSAGGEPAGL